jgi:hypothetical protein
MDRMRKGLDVNGERLTVGDLRVSLEGVPDDTPLVVCVPRDPGSGGPMAVPLTVTYAARSGPPFVHEPGAFVIGAVHRPPGA